MHHKIILWKFIVNIINKLLRIIAADYILTTIFQFYQYCIIRFTIVSKIIAYFIIPIFTPTSKWFNWRTSECFSSRILIYYIRLGRFNLRHLYSSLLQRAPNSYFIIICIDIYRSIKQGADPPEEQDSDDNPEPPPTSPCPAGAVIVDWIYIIAPTPIRPKAK